MPELAHDADVMVQRIDRDSGEPWEPLPLPAAVARLTKCHGFDGGWRKLLLSGAQVVTVGFVYGISLEGRR